MIKSAVVLQNGHTRINVILTERLDFPIRIQPASLSMPAIGASLVAFSPFRASDPDVVPMPNEGVQIKSYMRSSDTIQT